MGLRRPSTGSGRIHSRKGIGGPAVNFDAVGSIATPEPSLLTRLLMIFADLRNTIFRSPAAGP